MLFPRYFCTSSLLARISSDGLLLKGAKISGMNLKVKNMFDDEIVCVSLSPSVG